jgi:hypothetical protein
VCLPRRSSSQKLAEARRQMETQLESPNLTDSARAYISSAYERLQETARAWNDYKTRRWKSRGRCLRSCGTKSALPSAH